MTYPPNPPPPYPPSPVSGPVTPAHTATPPQYVTGAIRQHTSGAIAVRTEHPSIDGTLDWLVVTVDYGGGYASWDDVGWNVDGWADLPGPPPLATPLAYFYSTGQLMGSVVPSVDVEPVLSSEGTLWVSAGQGAVTPVVALTGGEGTLAAGLAVVLPVVQMASPDGAEGRLEATVVVILPLDGALTGDGQLDAAVSGQYPVPADGDLTGEGQLSAGVALAYLCAPAFSGGGALAAAGAVHPDYPALAQLGGAGTLSVTTVQQSTRPAALAGTGTLSVTVSAATSVAAQFGGGGALGGTAGHCAAFSGTGNMAGTAVFPATSPVTTLINTAGAFTYQIPYWCNYIDVVPVGAGAGGQGGTNSKTGAGGNPGAFGTGATWARGTTIPWSQATITGTIGAGGAGTATGSAPAAGASGGTTSVTGGNSANGGTGSTANTQPGGSPGSLTFNTLKYTAGAAQSTAGGTGNAPGGAGAGGAAKGAGGIGAPGGVWFTAYQTAGAP